MANVVPFQGLRYSSKLSSHMAELVTPPYDIISERDQNRFYRTHPQNIIRLEYGRINPADSDADNRYTRAGQTLHTWLEQDVLRVDDMPAFYVLQTEFADPLGVPRLFTGVLGRVKLEPLGEGSILPHERTFSGPKADRLNLLESTGVSFSPVFSLYQDPQAVGAAWLKKITRRKPWVNFKDWSGTRQALWVVNQPDEVKFLRNFFRAKKLMIADGHHRYSTALNYRDRNRTAATPDADYVMMCLADTADPGLTVLPVYRLVRNVPPAQWRALRGALETFFDIEKLANPPQLTLKRQAAEAQTGRPVLGCVGGIGDGAYLLKLKHAHPHELTAKELPGTSEAYRGLDVVILDRLILKGMLKVIIGEDAERVRYTKDPKEAAALVAKGEMQAAFLPGPPKLQQIWNVAKNKETMPQKSTYFLPKLITGLVMNPIRLAQPARK
jgi:uncharacterized protein (DUF1015 family)